MSECNFCLEDHNCSVCKNCHIHCDCDGWDGESDER